LGVEQNDRGAYWGWGREITHETKKFQDGELIPVDRGFTMGTEKKLSIEKKKREYREIIS